MGNIRKVFVIFRKIVGRFVKYYNVRESDFYRDVIVLGNENEFKIPIIFKISIGAMPSINSRILKILWEVHIKVEIAWRRDINFHVPLLMGDINCEF